MSPWSFADGETDDQADLQARRQPVGSGARRGPAPRWFIVSSFRPLAAPGGTIALPAGVTAHAKQLGTTTTACGQAATTWYRVWTEPFPGKGLDNCRACSAAIRS